MSYISFYRKWRPQAFSEVIGQEHIVKTLQNAISKNRLVHGYMFCGPKGTGKTSIARIFAKAINCVNGPAVEPCNKCENCISITAGSNIDIVEIDGASNRGIDNIRDLREKIKFLPVFLRKKIYIIDEAHQITGPAFNALLKTLEEPPEHVIFMMATTDPHDVIQTIMSRCQRFDFRPISLEGLRQKLKDIASSEDIDITDSALSIVAKYSDGSLRDAEGILEQLASFKGGRITVDDVSSILGIIDQDMLFELANIILEKNINQGLLFVSRLFSTSFSLNAFISEFLEHLYSLYVIKNYESPADILDMPDDFKEIYFNQAGLFTQVRLESLIDLFTVLLAQIKDSENPKTFFKAAVIKALNTADIKTAKNIAEIKTGMTRPDTVIAISSANYVPDIEKAKNITNIETNVAASDKKLPNEVVKTAPDKGVDTHIADASPAKEVSKSAVETESGKVTAKSAADYAPDAEKAKGIASIDTDKAHPDKVTPKESTGSASDKETAKDADIKKESEELKEHSSSPEKNSHSLEANITPASADNSLSDKNISTAGKQGLEKAHGEGLEGSLQDSKKTSGDVSKLIPEIWETVLVKIKIKSVPLQAVLKEVKRFKLLGNKMHFFLESKNKWHKTELSKPENKALIQELLVSLTGEKFEIAFDFISDENISESIDLAHLDRKIRAAGNLPQEHKDTPDFKADLTNPGSTDIDSGKNTAILNKGTDGKDSLAGSDTYGYFEEKFKVKEKQ